jgi:hypothetical protein
MAPHAPVQSAVEWQDVSKRHTCRICGATRGCRFDSNDSFACCVNRPSEWPLTNGAWLHRTSVVGASQISGPFSGATT